MGDRLTRKVAIVTGSSLGLGRRIAQVLALEGASVVLTARAIEGGAGSPLEAAVDEIREAGGEATAIRGDVADEGDVRRIVATTLDRYGGVDLLVNNAAMRLSTKLLDTSLADMDRIVRVNVLGPFLMWKHVLPIMIERGGGNVINIVSTNAAQQPFFGMAPYRMTKAALTFLSVDLAQEVEAHGIAVNALDPGPILSEGTAAIRAMREQRYDVHLPYHPQDPPGAVDDAILWLATRTGTGFSGRVVRRLEFGGSWGPGVDGADPG